jgi:anti-sigma factor RsiW
MSCELWQDWLDVYVDEGCTPEQLEGIEDHLRGCTSCSAEVLARMQMKRATRAAAARYAPSPEFQARIAKSLQNRRKSLWAITWIPGLAIVAASFVILAVSFTMLSHHHQREQAFAELLDLHVATMASSNPVDVVSTDRHTVKPWFQGKLPFTFNLPELKDSPYRLLGGRLMYFKHSPGAQLLFELRKHQLSVFILQDQPDSVPLQAGQTTANEKGFSMETWSELGLRYVIVGDSSPADLHALGDLLRAAGGQ